MKTKAFGDDNILHLGTYYLSEQLGEKKIGNGEIS